MTNGKWHRGVLELSIRHSIFEDEGGEELKLHNRSHGDTLLVLVGA
jgi:hypothetical protein